MSVNKHFRRAWVRVSYREAVRLFWEVWQAEENRDAALPFLARQCANRIFQERAGLILPGSEETTAREFMDYCQEHFPAEIDRATVEMLKEPEPELVH